MVIIIRTPFPVFQQTAPFDLTQTIEPTLGTPSTLLVAFVPQSTNI